MLSGEPGRFAIWFDQVDSWSDKRNHNGCLGYFIAEAFIFTANSTLDVDLYMLSQRYCMEHAVENERLFNMPCHIAYRQLYSTTYPYIDSGAEDNDFRYLATPVSLSDAGWKVFLVEHADAAKLIYGFWGNADKAGEVILERGEFQRVVKEAMAKFNSFVSSLPPD